MGKFADAPIHESISARILIIDIETSPVMSRHFGIRKQYITPDHIIEDERVICFAAQWYGAKRVIFRSEFHDGRDRMLADLYELLEQAQIVVHFNGTKFDIPKIEGELAIEGYTPTAPFKQVDLYHAVKRFGFVSHKLGFVAEKFELGGKMKHDGFDLWLQCLAGDEKAWRKMRAYCSADTVLTGRLYDRIRPWIRNHPNMALFAGDDEKRCRLCGCDDVVVLPKSEALTTVTAYSVHHCRWCGGIARSKHRKASAVLRQVVG